VANHPSVGLARGLVQVGTMNNMIAGVSQRAIASRVPSTLALQAVSFALTLFSERGRADVQASLVPGRLVPSYVI
jgi:hypothetical protein